MTLRRFSIALALMLTAGSTLAHNGHADASLASGFAHPFTGIDHALAMLAVGLYAARQAGRLRWVLPAGFVLAMLGGAGLGALGAGLPVVEGGIALSLLALGLLAGFAVNLPKGIAVGAVGVFALFHGSAHYAEMGQGSLLTFAAGFALAAAVLHAAGYALARWMPEATWACAIKRALGGLVAGAGLVLLGS